MDDRWRNENELYVQSFKAKQSERMNDEWNDWDLGPGACAGLVRLITRGVGDTERTKTGGIDEQLTFGIHIKFRYLKFSVSINPSVFRRYRYPCNPTL